MSFPGASKAKGDEGITIPLPASASALNAVLSGLAGTRGQKLGGGRVILKTGTLVLDTAILVPNHVTLEGSGAGTVLMAGSGMTGAMVKNSANGDRRFAIRNLSLWGNGENVTGISINTPPASPQEYADGMYRLDSLDIMDCGADALALAGRGEAKITNIQIRDAGARGLYVNSPDNMMTNISIGGAGSHGVEIVQSNNQLELVKAYYCGKSDSGHGFYIHDTILTKLIACEGQDNVGHGAYLVAADHASLDFVADSNGAGHNGRVFAGHGVVVHNSDFGRFALHARDRNVNTTRQQWGLYVSGWTSVASIDVMGQGNVLGTAKNTTGNTISGRVNGVIGNIT